jgi:putative serine protease PepD
MDTTPQNPGQDPFETPRGSGVGPDAAAQSSIPEIPVPPEVPAPPEPPVPPYFGPPPVEGAHIPLAGEPAPAAKPRRRRGVAVVVAAALAAGLIGGAAGGVIGNALDSDNGNAKAYVSGTAPVQSVADKNLTGVAAVAQAVTPSVVEVGVQLRQGTATGSGVILSDDGKILTNAHVVNGASNGSVKITFADGRTATARVLGTDTNSDLAVLKVDGVTGLKPATLGDSDQVRVGDQVVAIGSPEGLTGTVTSGIVSALNREVKVSDSEGGNGRQNPYGFPYNQSQSQNSSSGTTTYHAIQTDAAINPGNSGGPLLDLNGRVIGINSAIYSPTSSALGSDAGNVGLGFAIPINQVKALLGSLESGNTA